MRNALGWVSRLSVLLLLPACAMPAVAPSALLPTTGAQSATQRPVSALKVARLVTVPEAVEKAYTAALKETMADYKADPDIVSVTVSPLRPVFRLAQSGSTPVYIITAVGNLIGKVDREKVATAFSVGFAFDEEGRDTGFGSSCFIDALPDAPKPTSRHRLPSRIGTPWQFKYMANVPGGLNVALDLLHNRQMDELQSLYAGKSLQPLKPTPGPGRIVAIRHNDQVVGYIESLTTRMWEKNPDQAKGVEVVNVFDPQGVMITAEGRFLDPLAADNHRVFQFSR